MTKPKKCGRFVGWQFTQNYCIIFHCSLVQKQAWMTSSEEGWWAILEGWTQLIQVWFNCVAANGTTSFGSQVAGFLLSTLDIFKFSCFPWNKVSLLPTQVLNFKCLLRCPSHVPLNQHMGQKQKKHLLTPKKPPHLIRRTGTSLEELNGLSCLFRHTCLVATGFSCPKTMGRCYLDVQGHPFFSTSKLKYLAPVKLPPQ